MTETANRKDLELDYLLHPAGAFRTPMDVVSDPDMTVQEKRVILASWACDACAVEAAPDLRHPPTVPIVSFDDIMDALKKLDGETVNKPQYGKFISRARRLKDLYRSDQGRRSIFSTNPAGIALAGRPPDQARGRQGPQGTPTTNRRSDPMEDGSCLIESGSSSMS